MPDLLSPVVCLDLQWHHAGMRCASTGPRSRTGPPRSCCTWPRRPSGSFGIRRRSRADAAAGAAAGARQRIDPRHPRPGPTAVPSCPQLPSACANKCAAGKLGSARHASSVPLTFPPAVELLLSSLTHQPLVNRPSWTTSTLPPFQSASSPSAQVSGLLPLANELK